MKLHFLRFVLFVFVMLLKITSLASQTHAVKYTESYAVLPNPERGWYYLLMPNEDNSNSFLNSSLLNTIKDDSIGTRIVLHKILISNKGPIPASFMDSLQNEADLIRNSGFKVIYRFTYNWIQSFSPDDAPKSQVLAHLDQLKSFFSRNVDILLFIEPSFIGSWGEWHHSTNNLLEATNSTRLNDDSREILNKVLEVLPEERMTGLRYPHLKWVSIAAGPPNGGLGFSNPLDEVNAYNGSNASRIGYYNQRFVCNNGDMWSLTTTPSPERNYPLYMYKDTEFVPSWGEPEESAYAQSPESGERAIAEAKMFHFVSLNGYRASCPKVYLAWKMDSSFSELTNKLGYRFRLNEITFPDKARSGYTLTMNVSISNLGFARPVNPRIIEFVFRNVKSMKEYKVKYMPLVDERLWLPGAQSEKKYVVQLSLPEKIAAGSYQIFLNLPDPKPTLYGNSDYSIQMANSGMWERETGYNNLHHIVKIKRP